jgi:hypothetical protein
LVHIHQLYKQYAPARKESLPGEYHHALIYVRLADLELLFLSALEVDGQSLVLNRAELPPSSRMTPRRTPTCVYGTNMNKSRVLYLAPEGAITQRSDPSSWRRSKRMNRSPSSLLPGDRHRGHETPYVEDSVLSDTASR